MPNRLSITCLMYLDIGEVSHYRLWYDDRDSQSNTLRYLVSASVILR